MKRTDERSDHGPYRHLFLLIALISVTFVRPFFGASINPVGALDAILFVTLIFGAVAMRPRKKLRRMIVISAVATLASLALLARLQREPLLFAFIGSYALFLGLVACSVVGSLFTHGRRMTTDTFFGALSGYLILGLVWALLFVGVEVAKPGTFVFATGQPPSDAFFLRFLGFSFTTLTTLGYGNVAPATAQGDAIAGLEAVVGQLYLAVIIARVVAMQLAQDFGERASREH